MVLRCDGRIDAVAYSFGGVGGLIDVSFDEHEQSDTRSDRIVVGFRSTTTAASAATDGRRAGPGSRLLVTILSATSNDFVQLSLV